MSNTLADLSAGTKSLILTLKTPTDWNNTKPRNDLSTIRVWLSTTQGFTPSDSTLAFSGPFSSSITLTSLLANTTYYVRYAFISAIDPTVYTYSKQYSQTTLSDAVGIIGVLSNESATIPADSTGYVLSYANASTTMYVYKNGIDDTSNWTFTNTKSNVTCGEATTSNTQTIASIIADSGYVDITASRSGYSNITKRFDITKAKGGLNATAYWLTVSVAAIQKNIIGVFNPTTITAYGYSATGISAPALYSGRFKIYENNNITAIYTSSVNQNTVTYTPSSSSVTSIKIEFYLADGTTAKLDEQTIPVVSDGNTGANAISGSLTNPAYTVASDYQGTVVSYSIAGGTFKVYNGTEDITTGNGVTYTKFQVSSGLDIAIDSSTGVYTINSLSVDTGYATLRATYGTFIIDKIYSIAKSKTGQQGNSITGAAGSASFLITRTDNISSAPTTGNTSSEIYAAIQRINPVQGDLATISYNNRQNTIAYKYNGTIWETQAAWITGDLIVSGGITADKIKAGTITSTDSNFSVIVGKANSSYVAESGYVTTGILINRNNTASNNISVPNTTLEANYWYEVVAWGSGINWQSLGCPDLSYQGQDTIGTYFKASGGTSSGTGGIVRKIPGGALAISDITRFGGGYGFLSKFFPSLDIYSKYGTTARFYSDAAVNSISDTSVVNITGSASVGLDITSLSNRFATTALNISNPGYSTAIFTGGGNNAVVTINSTSNAYGTAYGTGNGYGIGNGIKVNAGSSIYASIDIANPSGSSGIAINAVGSIETNSKFISTANIASTSTTSGSLLVIGGAGISGAVYAGSLYDSGNRVLTTANAYSLPTASTSTLGGVKVDGSTITINGSGVISSSATSSSFNGGSISGTLTLTNTTASSSTITGALIVAGGMGITGKIYAADNITSYANITANVFYADNNYYWQVISGNPYLVFDSSDYISYDRSNNQLNTIIAGSGILALNTTAVQAYKPLRIYGTSSGYVGFNVQASAGSTTYTWPASPTSNYFLQTDGSGNLSWAAASGGGGTTYSEATPTTLGLVYGRVGTSVSQRNNSSTALGYQALAYVPPIPQFGSYNCTAIGIQALYSNTNGINNVAVGAVALYNNTGGLSNVAVGSTAGINQTYAIYNTYIGTGAGYQVTTGNYNTFIGGGAGYGVTTQDSNTALGNDSGYNIAYTNYTCLGANSLVTGNNQLQLGDSSTTSYAYGSIQNRSDIRDKADIRDTQLGLEFINALRPVDYKWDLREDYKPTKLNIPLPIPPIDPTPEQTAEYNTALETYNSAMTAWRESAKMSNLVHDGSKKRNRYHHGLIAQEVKAVLDAQGIDFGGYQDHKIKDGEDVLSIGYEELIAPLIKAVQQLTARVQELEAKNI